MSGRRRCIFLGASSSPTLSPTGVGGQLLPSFLESSFFSPLQVNWVLARKKLSEAQPPVTCFEDLMAIFAPGVGNDFLTKTLLQAME